MRKNIFLILLVIVAGTTFAQEATNKSINEICDCIKKIDGSISDDEQGEQAVLCMATAIGKNQEGLKKEFNITNDNMQQAMREIGASIGTKLISVCPESLPLLMKYAQTQEKQLKNAVAINPDTLKLNKKVCASFTSGKYKAVETYVSKMSTSMTDETAYTEVKDGFVYDSYENGKYTSKWSIKWLNGCEWEQTLIETSEPKLKAFFRKGDKLSFKAIGSSPEGDLWVASNLVGLEVLVRMRKVK